MPYTDQEFERCQYYFSDMEPFTLPDPRTAIPLRRLWWRLKKYVWFISGWGLLEFLRKILSFKFFGKRSSTRKVPSAQLSLNLQPGELVEVRSEKEIFATLDHEGKLRGLNFIPEMRKYCGKRFRVFKRLEKIILETTGELRTVRTPTVFLKGAICDGSAHGGCDRSCFIFWREAWLKRVLPEDSQEEKAKPH